MSDYRRLFDPGKLSEHELGCVAFVLNSPAYIDVFEPYLLSIKNEMQMSWKDRSQTRKDNMPDDYIAGNVAAIDGLLTLFKLILQQTDIDRIHTSMEEMTSPVLYERARQSGAMQPVVGLDQKASPDEYDPAQDY